MSESEREKSWREEAKRNARMEVSRNGCLDAGEGEEVRERGERDAV